MLLSVVTSVAGVKKIGKPLHHWHGREVLVEADPLMAVTGCGEIWDPTPLSVSVVPQVVKIVVPAWLEFQHYEAPGRTKWGFYLGEELNREPPPADDS